MTLVLEPFPDAELILGGSQEFRDLGEVSSAQIAVRHSCAVTMTHLVLKEPVVGAVDNSEDPRCAKNRL